MRNASWKRLGASTLTPWSPKTVESLRRRRIHLFEVVHVQERWHKFNYRLRAEMALAMWYQVIQQELPELKPLARAILADESRTTLNKNFSHSKQLVKNASRCVRLGGWAGRACLRFNDLHLAQLAPALSSNLLHLQLSLWTLGTKSTMQLDFTETFNTF